MKFKSLFALIVLAAATAFAAPQQTYSIVVQPNGFADISFTNKFFNGVGTLEGKSDKRWVPLENFFIVDQRFGRVVLPLPVYYTTNTVITETNSITTTNYIYTTNSIYPELRLRSVSIGPGGFKNLALAYGNIDTIAGNGVIPSASTNAWLPQYEGTNATAVTFSDPRAIAADSLGNIYVSEHGSHAISVISNGIVRTAVGTRVPDLLPDEFPIPATESPLNSPSGLYMVGDKLYILDNGNSRVVVYTNGLVEGRPGKVASTVFYDTNGIANGNGLWVRNDSLEMFYTDGTKLKRWRFPVNGLGGMEIVATNFVDLAGVTVNPELDTIVADRGDNVIWRVNNDGIRQIEAGNRFPAGRSVGRATGVSLPGPSSLWYMPFGGYLVGLDNGASVFYVDSGDTTAKLVFGAPGVHDGDGDWFQRGRKRPKISNVKSVIVDPFGDILILEGGYIRRINFLRHLP